MCDVNDVNEESSILEDRRLEIENRIRNMFWTVSGDYSLEIDPDIYDFSYSKYIPLYDAIKQGAFQKYFDIRVLSEYVMKKTYLGAEEEPLMDLVQTCIDAAIYPKVNEEREGVDEIRRQAFRDILAMPKKSLNANIALNLKRAWMMQSIGRYGELPHKLKVHLETINELMDAKDTEEVVETINWLYDAVYDVEFVKKHGGMDAAEDISKEELLKTLKQEYPNMEDLDELFQKLLKALQNDMLQMKNNERGWNRPGLAKLETMEATAEMQNTETNDSISEYVEQIYGKPFLKSHEQEKYNRLFCRGIHKGSKLHYTRGVLVEDAYMRGQHQYVNLLRRKNRGYYNQNHRIVKRNIINLSDTLRRTLVQKTEKITWRDRSGQIVPGRLWKIGRTEDDKLFDKSSKQDARDFVVDILMDASGSQLKRAPQVATQGYILSRALSEVKIPHRVTSFCTFWEYTILHRMVDYEDGPEAANHIFEYHASSFNRDGLAIRAICESLLNRREENKILIILSDGRPNDAGRNSQSTVRREPYAGEAAAKDTAMEIRKARNQGIVVLGVFAGDVEDLATEKKIFGKDFAYISNINGFAHVVGKYLCKQIESDD